MKPGFFIGGCRQQIGDEYVAIFYHIESMKKVSDDIQINPERVHHRLEALAEIGSLKNGGVQRLALTDEDARARSLLVEWLEGAGAEVKTDRMGNIFGMRKGRQELPAVLTGR